MIDDIKVFAADWDETVTSTDTLSLVGKAAYTYKPQFEPKWSYFVDAYLKDYNDYSQAPRDTLEQEIAFLKGLKPIENASVARVEQSQLFRGVPQQVILDQASSIQYRPGWWDLVGRLTARNIPIIIISVHWSAALIRQAFQNHGYTAQVYANEVAVQDGMGTGALTKRDGIRTADDKERVLEQVREQYQKPVHYFGDSSTDLLALMAADTGVVVGKPKTKARCEQLGISLRFIDDWTLLAPDI